MDTAHESRRTTNRVGFLLAYGYFRATLRFFSPERYHERGSAFVSRIVGASVNEFSGENYKERTRLDHQSRILDLQGFQRPTSDVQAPPQSRAPTCQRSQSLPRIAVWSRTRQFRAQAPQTDFFFCLVRIHAYLQGTELSEAGASGITEAPSPLKSGARGLRQASWSQAC